MTQPLKQKKLKLNDSRKTYKTIYNQHQKRCPFHQKYWNEKVESQEIPEVTGKFDLGLEN